MIFRFDFELQVYIIAGIISMPIDLLTISFQSFLAVGTNPVNILREKLPILT